MDEFDVVADAPELLVTAIGEYLSTVAANGLGDGPLRAIDSSASQYGEATDGETDWRP